MPENKDRALIGDGCRDWRIDTRTANDPQALQDQSGNTLTPRLGFGWECHHDQFQAATSKNRLQLRDE
ncbi:MAG: hypothetical protein WCI03_03900 [bacterium]